MTIADHMIDSLMVENDDLRERIAELEAENARLRSCLSDDAENARQIMGENAKLRELVRIMHGELVSCEDNGYVCGGHKFDERVRELRIEVPHD